MNLNGKVVVITGAAGGLGAALVERFGRLDVMINNAGVLNPNARLHNLTLDDWRRVIDVNLLGVVNGMTSALRVMRSQGGGAAPQFLGAPSSRWTAGSAQNGRGPALANCRG